MSSEINVYDLPRVPLTNLKLLPAEAGLYFAIDDSGRIWYVGIAKSLRDRRSTHERLVDFKCALVTHFAWTIDLDAGSRNSNEQDFIRLFDPPLNDLHRTGRRPVIPTGRTRDEELQRFIEIKNMQSELEYELNKLKANIVSHCEEFGGKLDLPLAKVYLSSRTSYSYSSTVDLLSQELKKQKDEEVENGTAAVTSKAVFPVVRASSGAKVAKSKPFPISVLPQQRMVS